MSLKFDELSQDVTPESIKAEMVQRLKEKGLDVDVNAITVEEAKDSILKALKKGGKADD